MSYYRRRSRWPYRSWRRRFNVQRSQQQGTRRFKVTIPVDEMKALPVATTGSSYGFSVCPFLNMDSTAGAADSLSFAGWGNLMTNKLFLTYSTLYDEVRIVGLKICVSVMGYPSGVSSGGVKIVSCCDRRGNRDDVTTVPSGDDFLSSADSLSTEYTSLERAKQYRSIWARDVIERGAFYDCTKGSWSVTSGAHSPYSYTCVNSWRNMGSVGFCPLIFYRFVFAGTPSTVQSCAVSIKAQWALEFRNPKWNSVAPAAAKFSEMKEEEVKSYIEGVDDADHEEEIDPKTGKKVKFEEPVYEESVVPDDDDVGMDDESSQPQLTKEELLEMLRKIDEKKS